MPTNPALEAAGFDQNRERLPLETDKGTDLLKTAEALSVPFVVQDLEVSHNTFRAWRYGARVKNGAGFFAAPPQSQNPKKNSDYMRFFVDSSVDSITKTQKGIGIISLPISDELWFEATGDQPVDGNIIMKLRGPHSVGSNNTGIVDLFSVLNLGLGGAAVEAGLFNNQGATYFNTTTNKIRWYNGTIWQDLASGSGTTQPVITHQTHNLAVGGSVTFAHGFSGVPKLIRIQSNIVGDFSDGSYDGTNQMSTYWGTHQAGTSTGSIIYLTPSVGNQCLGQITALSSTLVTVNFTPLGAPVGTADFILTAS